MIALALVAVFSLSACGKDKKISGEVEYLGPKSSEISPDTPQHIKNTAAIFAADNPKHNYQYFFDRLNAIFLVCNVSSDVKSCWVDAVTVLRYE